MHPENLNRWWRKHRAELGLEGFTLHRFRHLRERACRGRCRPEVRSVAHWPSDAAFTMKLYTHHNIESEKRATLKIANVIYGVSETGEAHLDDTVLSQP